MFDVARHSLVHTPTSIQHAQAERNGPLLVFLWHNYGTQHTPTSLLVTNARYTIRRSKASMLPTMQRGLLVVTHVADLNLTPACPAVPIQGSWLAQLTLDSAAQLRQCGGRTRTQDVFERNKQKQVSVQRCWKTAYDWRSVQNTANF
jgi:hypothetical protein